MLNNNKGQTLVELSLVIVLLLMLVVGFTEFGRAWHNTTVLNNAARAGARYASTHPLSSSYVTDVEDYTAFQVMTGLKVARGEVVVVLEGYSSGSPGATPITMTEGTSPPLKPGARVSVTVSHTFEGLGGNIVPVISGPRTLMRRASMRYEGN